MRGGSKPCKQFHSPFLCVFICLLLRWGSFRRIERELTRRRLQKFIPQQERFTCCQNTIGYGLEHIDTAIQEEQLAFVVKKLKRNRAYNDTIGGLHIVALDGTEYLRSESIHCDECLEYHIQTKDSIITHYGFARLLREPLHRAVIAQKVGCSLKPIMQEATDAWRIRWAYGRQKRFCPKIKGTITLLDMQKATHDFVLAKVNLLLPSV
ncbi:hypothetical protein H8E77_23135 [bacterium]|nr:hypothetical protein [bacterium]